MYYDIKVLEHIDRNMTLYSELENRLSTVN